MNERKNQAGIALGTLFGLMHALWVTAVAADLGQPIMDSLESAHFLSSKYTTTSFDPLTAILGITAATVSGYLIGWLFMYIYIFAGRELN